MLKALIGGFSLLIGLYLSPVWGRSAAEYDLKATFLYKFAQYTEWPIALNEPFSICVLGADPFNQALQHIAGKKLNNLNVVTQNTNSLEYAKHCQVLFLNPANNQQLKQWQLHLQGLPILTVSDNPAAWDYGVMIVLVTEPNRIGFNINRTSAQEAGINFRSPLLQLAQLLR